MSAPARPLAVHDLGLTGYEPVLRLQRGLQLQRRERGGQDILLLTEHRPVLTLGRGHPEPALRVPSEEIARLGIAVVPTERGGDITYHGPGQLVAYGIVDLREWGIGAVDYVSGLERAVIAVAAEWGVAAERDGRGRGAWVAGRKIASIGVNVRRGVTMHGVALNVSPELGPFDLIDPCGMPGVEVTSLALAHGRPIEPAAVREAFIRAFAAVFGCQPQVQPAHALTGAATV